MLVDAPQDGIFYVLYYLLLNYDFVYIITSVYIITAQEMKFSVKDLVTFTDEIRNGKLYFLCRVNCA